MPFIIREPKSGTRQVMLAELGKHDIAVDDMNIFLEVGNAEAIVRTVEAGYGVSFVSRAAAACALQRGSVVEVPIRAVDLRRDILMVRKYAHLGGRAMEVFWSFVHDPVNADLLHFAEQ
jgi:DNA-binding transcriptional LysR family regulator